MTNVFHSIIFIFTATLVFGQQSNKSITIQGNSRNYIEYLPTNYSTSEYLPLVFVLHGLGGTNNQMTAIGFNQIADTARCIVLYPQALNNGFGQAAWNNGTGFSSSANDVELMNQLMSLYEIQNNIDPTRIYITGFSMGGIMTHRLALALNHRVAAIGPMAGTLSTSDLQNYTPTYATPVIHLHGTADGTVPYNSNPLPTLSLVPETMAFWRDVHNCDLAADSTRIPDTASDNITIDRFVYNNCDTDGAVELWRFNNADHVYLYEPLNDITESKVIWNFFRKWQHPSPSLAKLSEQTKSSSFKIYPNPVQNNLKFQLNQDQVVTIRNQDGKIIQTINGFKGENNLKIELSKGTYYLISKSESTVFIVN
ncbi:MAG: T9SS type A sorting domain-containing protein [Bacteroidetes bacterium]|nr:T9SS type A sorting domain-containing protein [Bacteroidota bacterium]